MLCCAGPTLAGPLKSSGWNPNPFAIQWWGLLDFPVGSGIADTSLDIKVTVCVVLTAASSTAGMCHPERNKWKGPLCHPVSMKEMT